MTEDDSPEYYEETALEECHIEMEKQKLKIKALEQQLQAKDEKLAELKHKLEIKKKHEYYLESQITKHHIDYKKQLAERERELERYRDAYMYLKKAWVADIGYCSEHERGHCAYLVGSICTEDNGQCDARV